MVEEVDGVKVQAPDRTSSHFEARHFNFTFNACPSFLLLPQWVAWNTADVASQDTNTTTNSLASFHQTLKTRAISCATLANASQHHPLGPGNAKVETQAQRSTAISVRCREAACSRRCLPYLAACIAARWMQSSGRPPPVQPCGKTQNCGASWTTRQKFISIYSVPLEKCVGFFTRHAPCNEQHVRL